MIVKFGSTVYGKKVSNKGSCNKLANYLEKENENKPDNEKRHFFTHFEEGIQVNEVINSIDKNIKKLGKKDSKYFLLNINPSEKELALFPKDKIEDFLMDYTRNLMDDYAKNFNKGLLGKDLLYYAKYEENRYDKITKKPKPGLNYHVHVIISRRDLEQKYKLSPETNHINSKVGVIRGGFNRNTFRLASEKLFDRMTGYDRSLADTFVFQNQKRIERQEIEREARMSETPKVETETTANKGLETNYSNIDWSLLFPPEANTSMYDFEEEEMIRKKKKRGQDMSM